MNEGGETALPFVQTRTETEIRPDLKLSDVYTEEGYQRFKEALKSSSGKCLIVVHPFFSFYREEADVLLKDPQQWQLKRFVDGLKNLIATIQNRGVNLPILILERTEVGQMFKTPEVSSLVEKRIKKSLKDILGCDRGDFFFTETQQSAPIPLLSPKEHHDLYPTGVPDFAKTMENFILKLKNAGLNLALIAGSNFGGTEYFESIYHDAEFNPSDGLFARSKWKLRDFYNQKLYGEAKHPFQIITPRGCMADVIRSLAKWGEGIKFGVTQATYPQQMPRTDQLVRPPSPYNLTYWQATN